MSEYIQSPNNLEEYKQWFVRVLKYPGPGYVRYYDGITRNLQMQFVDSPFWTKLQDELPNINDEYKRQKGNDLFAKLSLPEISIKPLDSLIDKTYRKNVLKNEKFPEQPSDGWIDHTNWLYRIKDVLRTTIIVRYFDGVQFIIDKMSEIARSLELGFEYDYEARWEGYYAAHAGVRIPMSIYDPNVFESKVFNMNIEIQIMTEIQGVIKDLLHAKYESNRLKRDSDNQGWKWNCKCDEFDMNYLGHIVHYVEGMVVNIRDKQTKEFGK